MEFAASLSDSQRRSCTSSLKISTQSPFHRNQRTFQVFLECGWPCLLSNSSLLMPRTRWWGQRKVSDQLTLETEPPWAPQVHSLGGVKPFFVSLFWRHNYDKNKSKRRIIRGSLCLIFGVVYAHNCIVAILPLFVPIWRWHWHQLPNNYYYSN